MDGRETHKEFTRAVGMKGGRSRESEPGTGDDTQEDKRSVGMMEGSDTWKGQGRWEYRGRGTGAGTNRGNQESPPCGV